MSGRLILLLALFGLAMAVATVYAIPAKADAQAWLGVIVVSALVIARLAPGRFFLHGFLVGLANWVSVTGTHVILFDAFAARHAQDVAAMRAMAVPTEPRALMSVLGPALGTMRRFAVPIPGASAIAIGSLAWIGSRFLAPRRAPAPSR